MSDPLLILERAHDGIDMVPQPEPIAYSESVTGWWGKITACTPGTGIGKAVPAAGFYPNLGASLTRTKEEDVILGLYAPILKDGPGVTGYGYFVPSGPEISPKWTMIHHIRVPYADPSGPFAGVQYLPTTKGQCTGTGS